MFRPESARRNTGRREGMVMESRREEESLKIGKRSLIIAFVILFLLMMTVGILTQVIPTGSYERVTVDGKETIVEDSFRFTDADRLPVYRWFTAPIELLGSSDGAVVIVIIFFLLTVIIAFSLLEKSDIMSLFISKAVRRFSNMKYLLMAIHRVFLHADGRGAGNI